MNCYRVLFLLAGLTVVIAGCTPTGTARHVLQSPDGGVIAMPSNHDANRAKAHDLMMKRFPNGYVIEKEEEVVTGQVTTQNTRSDTHSEDLVGTKKKTIGSLDTTRTSRTVETHDRTEYRITYRAGPIPPEQLLPSSGPIVPTSGK